MNENTVKENAKVDGVIIGVVAAISTDGLPLVAYPGNSSELPLIAKSTIEITSDAIGREVALLFEGGDISLPIIMGLIHKESLRHTDSQRADLKADDATSEVVGLFDGSQEVLIDGERFEMRAKKEIVLKCGKASITMTRAGKVIIRGAYISTRSTGANRIKGGSVQIN